MWPTIEGSSKSVINHDLPNLTQRILRASCSQASECGNNSEALNDLPRGVSEVLDQIQTEGQGAGQAPANRGR